MVALSLTGTKLSTVTLGAINSLIPIQEKVRKTSLYNVYAWKSKIMPHLPEFQRIFDIFVYLRCNCLLVLLWTISMKILHIVRIHPTLKFTDTIIFTPHITFKLYVYCLYIIFLGKALSFRFHIDFISKLKIFCKRYFYL